MVKKEFTLEDIKNKIKNEHFTEISDEEIDYLRKKFYKKLNVIDNVEVSKIEYLYDEDFYQLLLEKKVSLKTNIEIQELLLGYGAKVLETNDIDGFYREEFERKYTTRVRFFKKKGKEGQFYYDHNFFKFISNFLYQIPEISIIPTANIEDTYALYLQRAEEGSKLILNGNEINELSKKLKSLEIDYLNEKINYLVKLQLFSASFDDLQQDFEEEFLSIEQVINNTKEKYKIQVNNEDINEIIKEWYRLSSSFQDINIFDYTFFVNQEFYLDFQLFLLKKSHDENAQMDFRIGFPKRPLILKVKKDNSQREEKKIEELNKKWIIYKKEYEEKKQNLDYQISIKHRGGWTLNKSPDFFFEEGEWVYWRTSIFFQNMFDDLFSIVTTQQPSEDKDPKKLLELFYNQIAYLNYPDYYKELNFEEFQTKMKQQYIYFSDNVKRIRLDLLRNIEPKENTFQGGLLHILAKYEGFSNHYGSKKDNVKLNPNKMFYYIRQIALHGELEKSEEQINGNYKLALIKDFKEPDGNIKKYRIGMYYDCAKEQYFINTFNRI